MSRHPIPEGHTAAVPYLSVHDGAAAITFYVRAFGAVETMRLAEPSGKIGHAELSIGAARFSLADEYPDLGLVGPKTLGGTAVTIHVYVEDVDTLVTQAVEAGATLLRPVKDEFYGDRTGQLEDPFGHVWSVQTRVEDVSPKQMQKRLDAMMKGSSPKPSPSPAPKAATKSKSKR